MNPKMSQLRKKAMALPLLPGVYIMHDKSGKIIYIGKAKALKNRVSQYFGSQNNHAEKVRRMVDNVDDFEYIITDSEFEANGGVEVTDVSIENIPQPATVKTCQDAICVFRSEEHTSELQSR